MVSEIARKYLTLALTEDVGPIRGQALLNYFGGIDQVLHAPLQQLMQVDGIGRKTAQSLDAARRDDRVEKEIERAKSVGAQILCPLDSDYPPMLRHISDPPLCIFVRGTLDRERDVAVAIVGTRRCSHYGLEQAFRFGEMLARAGFTVVSGLARGVDAAAHQGALAASGRTFAVLGNGLGSIYPPEHEELASKIEKSGALISEFRIDAPADRGHFPQRNRLIAGLGVGVVVIEAGSESGALITARLAAEYNREVFALPGRVDDPSRSAGVNGLIRDGGAKLVTCLKDVLDELGAVGEIMCAGAARESLGESLTNAAMSPLTASNGHAEMHAGPELPQMPKALFLTLSAGEHAVYSAVEDVPVDSDTVCDRTGLPIHTVTGHLTNLQLKGYVRRLPGNQFARSSAYSTAKRT